MEVKRLVVKMHPNDNVLVALTDLNKGESVVFEGQSYLLQDTIKAKHKFYTSDLSTGDEVIMYGVLVGKVQNNVLQGSLMTTDNLKHAAEPYGYRHVDFSWQAPDVSKYKERTFKGYKRSDGRVGTANYWLFVPTVFCENRNLDVIKEALHKQLGYSVSDKYTQFTHQLLKAYQEG
ncbi:MAG TPA: UxaA family hydrolase, partial [Flavobacterium sp.]|nr:UxaA family hydrolase [Flavobacterium sp.]